MERAVTAQPRKSLVAARDNRPGLDPRRLMRLMGEAIERCHLDLSGRTVLTEAASGAYVITPVLAAMAGAEVYALAGPTSYATTDELQASTADLARHCGVFDRIHFVRQKIPEIISAADIVTNSGQVRPITAAVVAEMKPTAVVPLMYESWEYRRSDVDLEACRARGIPVAGTNESHPIVDAFSFLGPMAVRLLHDAGVAVYRSRIVLLCDNPFAPFIARYLRKGGAEVVTARRLTPTTLTRPCDAVLVALRPRTEPRFTAADARMAGRQAPGAVLVQFWGDTDRKALAASEVPVWPVVPPAAGHMGVLTSDIGPEAVVRLQSGGLKVGELLARGLDQTGPEERGLAQILTNLTATSGSVLGTNLRRRLL
jgi:hypothetical protein